MTTAHSVTGSNGRVKLPKGQRMLFRAQVTCSGCAGVGELYDYELLARGAKGWRYCPVCRGEGIVEASITIEDLAESLRGLLHSQAGGA